MEMIPSLGNNTKSCDFILQRPGSPSIGATRTILSPSSSRKSFRFVSQKAITTKSESLNIPQMHHVTSPKSSIQVTPWGQKIGRWRRTSDALNNKSASDVVIVSAEKQSLLSNLWFAINNNNQSEILEIIKEGVDLDAHLSGKPTPLMCAVLLKNYEITKILLDAGANPNIPSFKNVTPLIKSCELGIEDLVTLLISKGADKKHAIQSSVNYANIVKLLLESGVDVNDRDDHLCTALIKAAGKNQFETVKLLLENKADINAKNHTGTTALMRASSRGYAGMIKLLVSKGADINLMNVGHQTPLSLSIVNKRVEAAELLINLGAKTNISDINGNTPLMDALEPGLERIADILLRMSPDVNAANREGTTPLIRACQVNHQFVQRLIAMGADVNAADSCKNTPLIIAAKSSLAMCQLLIKHGADCFAENNNKITPLVSAIEGTSKESHLIVEYLLDLTFPNKIDEAKVPLLYHSLNGSPRNLQLLLAHGVSVEDRLNGRLPLEYALEKSSKLEHAMILIKKHIENARNGVEGHTPIVGIGKIISKCKLAKYDDDNFLLLLKKSIMYGVKFPPDPPIRSHRKTCYDTLGIYCETTMVTQSYDMTRQMMRMLSAKGLVDDKSLYLLKN